MNLPNQLTIVRIFLTFIFIFLLPQGSLGAKVLAVIVFTIASLTDFLDGYIARKYNLISRFGKIMDPIADKFLILSAFFIFMQMGFIAIWMFAVICAREVGVTVLRLMAMRKGVALAAEKAGKIKTVLQIVVIYLIMLLNIGIKISVESRWYDDLVTGAFHGVYFSMLAVVGITLWSGLTFIWNNRKEIFYVR